MVVLYRKYRPQKIAEIDSVVVRERLGTILSSGRVPHAFLFCGPKGTGKTSAARIIAKSINCEKNEGKGEPCNKCIACVSITNGNNLDIIEIDAASNRGIDEIRELRDKIRLSPSGARKKVYIIDEVHMLTNEAFNALLKTLEEPPEHVIFILCTTNSEKLPETIISRCTEIDFRRANLQDLIASLKRVKRGEGREIEEKALKEIASLSEGSYRDAHKLLEEVLTVYPRAKITAETVDKVLGRKQFLEKGILAWLANRDAKNALLWLADAVEKGTDLRILTLAILETLHAYLLKKYTIVNENFNYEQVMEGLGVEDLKKLISLFSRVSQELRTALIPQLPLELAIVEWCEGGGDEGSVATNFSATQGSLPSSFGHSTQAKIGEGAKELGDLEGKWREVISAVKPYNYSIAGLLRSCRPVSFDRKELTIEAFYKFHFERLNEPKVRELLEKVVQDLLGEKIKIFPKLREKKEG